MSQINTKLPDIISDTSPALDNQLEWVGMEKIALPVNIPVTSVKTVGVNAFADVFVSLDSAAKGIHMSRLYLKLQEALAEKELTYNNLSALLEGMLHSQKGESNNARVVLSFDLPMSKVALLSSNSGWQAYPMVITQDLIGGKQQTVLELTIPYSSTCPCSASLARQLIAEDLNSHFASDTLDKSELIEWLTSSQQALATPHNQRSFAYLKLVLDKPEWPDLANLIVELEKVIGTPVQTAVKREDEQAFAQLNGSNLMFCEDAARKLDTFLTKQTWLQDFWFKVEHQESLHAHNAVVIHKKQQSI